MEQKQLLQGHYIEVLTVPGVAADQGKIQASKGKDPGLWEPDKKQFELLDL